VLFRSDPFWFRNANNRVHHEIDQLLSTWSNPRKPDRFVNPFTWISGRAPPSPADSSLRPVCFGDIDDLGLFIRECSPIHDWTRGIFPPTPSANCFSDESDVKAFVIQPWYSIVYDQLITNTECCPSSALVMGNPGTGKSTFVLYLLARLIASRPSTVFDHRFVLIDCGRSGSRHHIRVNFRGVVRLISVLKFHRLSARAFVIVDGLTYEKTSGITHYLSIVSPSECVAFPGAKFRRYVPPITDRQLELLSGLSKRYRLIDCDEGFPRLDPEYGSIQTRMRITGGNLRLLFCNYSLTELKGYYMEVVHAIKFTEVPTKYFARTIAGEQEPYHRAFGCLPQEPFIDPGKISFASSFVKEMLGAAFMRLQNKDEYDAIRWAGTFIHRLLGFSLNNPSIRGLLFEDLCYDRICCAGSEKYSFELFCREHGTIEDFTIPSIHKVDTGAVETIPKDWKRSWLWASDNARIPGFDAIFCNGEGILVIQITRGLEHRPIDLSQIMDRMEYWINNRVNCYFVFLTDSRDHRDHFLRSAPRLKCCKSYQNVRDCVGVLVCNDTSKPVGLDFPDSTDPDARPVFRQVSY
jgi:hypothetical protein